MQSATIPDPYISLLEATAPTGGLETLVRRDQLAAIRRGTLIAMPVNDLLQTARLIRYKKL
jgi:hypothetical protein